MQERNFLIHPSIIALSLLIAGISALFLGFSGSYLYTRIQSGVSPVALPSLFYFNTLILLASSYTLIKAKRAYLDDQTKLYQKFLIATLGLTLMFIVSQILAWQQLFSQEIMINHSNMASYLYILSIVHFAHVLIGIPFLSKFIHSAFKNMKEPVTVLIYFSDPDKKRKLKLLSIYWHYLDVLWIYLVIFLLVNYLIQ